MNLTVSVSNQSSTQTFQLNAYLPHLSCLIWDGLFPISLPFAPVIATRARQLTAFHLSLALDWPIFVLNASDTTPASPHWLSSGDLPSLGLSSHLFFYMKLWPLLPLAPFIMNMLLWTALRIFGNQVSIPSFWVNRPLMICRTLNTTMSHKQEFWQVYKSWSYRENCIYPWRTLQKSSMVWR